MSARFHIDVTSNSLRLTPTLTSISLRWTVGDTSMLNWIHVDLISSSLREHVERTSTSHASTNCNFDVHPSSNTKLIKCCFLLPSQTKIWDFDGKCAHGLCNNPLGPSKCNLCAILSCFGNMPNCRCFTLLLASMTWDRIFHRRTRHHRPVYHIEPQETHKQARIPLFKNKLQSYNVTKKRSQNQRMKIKSERDAWSVNARLLKRMPLKSRLINLEQFWRVTPDMSWTTPPHFIGDLRNLLQNMDIEVWGGLKSQNNAKQIQTIAPHIYEQLKI